MAQHIWIYTIDKNNKIIDKSEYNFAFIYNYVLDEWCETFIIWNINLYTDTIFSWYEIQEVINDLNSISVRDENIRNTIVSLIEYLKLIWDWDKLMFVWD